MKKIKNARKKAGLTQKELGTLLGVSQAAIGQFEKEGSNLQLETIRKIADALNIKLYELVDDWSVFSPDEYKKDLTNQGGGFFGKEAPEELQKKFITRIGSKKNSISHFNLDDYTDEELKEIKLFAEFIKSKRKDPDTQGE